MQNFEFNDNYVPNLNYIGTENVLIVPKTINGNPVTPKVLDDIKHKISDYYGGYTALEGEGAWKNSDGEIIKEPVIYLMVSFNPDSSKDFDKFVEIAEYVKNTLSQQEVYFSVDKESYII